MSESRQPDGFPGPSCKLADEFPGDFRLIQSAISFQPDAVAAAREAARGAAEGVAGPGWALAFAGGRHDQRRFLDTVTAELGCPVWGGSAVGLLANQRLGYGGFEAAVMAFPGSIPAPRAIRVPLEAGREAECGAELARALSAEAGPGRVVLLLFTLVLADGSLAVATRVLDSLYGELGDEGPHIIGGGLLKDFRLGGSALFDGGEVLDNQVMALVLPEGFQARTRIMHACIPVSAYMRITKMDGPEVLELDGRPALEVIRELLAGPDGGSDITLPFSVLLGSRIGDRFSEYDENEYVNRLIIDVDSNRGSIRLFETDFGEGTDVQLMLRDNPTMLSSVEQGVSRLLEEDGNPDFALYFDCAGRAGVSCGSETEDASIVQGMLSARTPLLGCYVGREIAPFMGRSRPLDWTGVLSLISFRGDERHA